MIQEFQQKLENYAELLIKVGLNLQKGQHLSIQAPLSTASFVKIVARKAYEAGATIVLPEFYDEEFKKIRIEHSNEEFLEVYPEWKAKGMIEFAEQNGALLNLIAPNPSILKNSDPAKVAALNKAAAIATKDFSAYIGGGKINWLIAAHPSDEWAESVFPELDKEKALDELWKNIFYTTRADQDDTVGLWKDHIASLNTHADRLNSQDLRLLHYKGPGTDLTIELHPETQWLSAEFTSDTGTKFVPNLPTEEVFTIPVKDGVNGIVSSTKPLNYGGTIIKDFSLTFKDGKVVDFSAEEGYETLKNLLDLDEGARHLGEVALVPHDSPISNTNVVFNNTLFDENASCHLALGRALQVCVKDGNGRSQDELADIGFNQSGTHVDFMIGSGELSIEGTKADGTKVSIFEKGDWAE